MQNTLPTFNDPLPGIYIGGQWLAGGETLTVVNPATEKPLANVGSGDAGTVDQAVRAAGEAFPGWAARSGAGAFLCVA